MGAGDLEAAARAHDEAISLLEPTSDRWGLGVCLALRARTALDAGDPDGERLARAALPVARVSADRHVIGIALEQLAQLDLAAGRTDSAKEAATECLAMHEAVGYPEGRLPRFTSSPGVPRRAEIPSRRGYCISVRSRWPPGSATQQGCARRSRLAALAAAEQDFEETGATEADAHQNASAAGGSARVVPRRWVPDSGARAEMAGADGPPCRRLWPPHRGGRSPSTSPTSGSRSPPGATTSG